MPIKSLDCGYLSVRGKLKCAKHRMHTCKICKNISSWVPLLCLQKNIRGPIVISREYSSTFRASKIKSNLPVLESKIAVYFCRYSCNIYYVIVSDSLTNENASNNSGNGISSLNGLTIQASVPMQYFQYIFHSSHFTLRTDTNRVIKQNGTYSLLCLLELNGRT